MSSYTPEERTHMNLTSPSREMRDSAELQPARQCAVAGRCVDMVVVEVSKLVQRGLAVQ